MRRVERVCVVTGARSEYGLLKPVMEEIGKHFELQLVATGMHLLSQFGDTLQEIESDGFSIYSTVEMMHGGDQMADMARSIGTGIHGLTDAFEELKPDVVILLGDRIETLAAAIAASYSGIVVGHLHGGDRSQGGVDEYSRHAITKMSHIHFPATATSAERILRLGEERSRIHMVGAPGLDVILNEDLPGPQAISERFGHSVPPILLVMHPVSTSPDAAEEEMRIVVDALLERELPVIALYPNADAGGRRMVEVLDEHSNWIQVHRSLPRPEFLGLMRDCAMMVGNSSSGIIEAPSFHIPVVNIGPRQNGRERAGYVIDVPCSATAIREAIDSVLAGEHSESIENAENPYGDGTASVRIAAVLQELDLDTDLLRKEITY